MNPQILVELNLTAVALVQGIWLMMVYDGLRVLRIVVPHKVWMTGIEDILYWIYAGISVFRLLYRSNDGTIRWYMIASVTGGMLIYDRLFSRHLLRVLQKLVKSFKMRSKKKKKLVSK